jgi:hypothetical protein
MTPDGATLAHVFLDGDSNVGEVALFKHFCPDRFGPPGSRHRKMPGKFGVATIRTYLRSRPDSCE